MNFQPVRQRGWQLIAAFRPFDPPSWCKAERLETEVILSGNLTGGGRGEQLSGGGFQSLSNKRSSKSIRWSSLRNMRSRGFPGMTGSGQSVTLAGSKLV
ncbi:Hypothetical predicted protein [Xyrichtys novacula]|uniref:Uncharacterized protein n=1 Tax=Xyrichtys novacula TaxID=13765 RepID=A0AAV1H1V7_XYRNO|nr:Hypothetical predicted protein [Xyrichtys novacula]